MAPRAKQRSCSVCTLPVLSVLFDEDLIKLYYHPFFTIDNHFGVPSWDSLPTNSFDSDLLALSRHWERELTYILSVIPAQTNIWNQNYNIQYHNYNISQ